MARCKGKGSSFERDMCRTLSLWWSKGKRDDIFWRSSNSGGRATVRSRAGRGTFGQYGDVQATDPIGQPLLDLCTIELKRGYNRVSVADALDAPPRAANQWMDWVYQAKEEASNAGVRNWMLITRRDRRDEIVFIPTELRCALIQNGASFDCISRQLTISFAPLDDDWTRIYAYLLSDFLIAVTSDSVMNAAKGQK